jgi:hypothetical protein
VNHPMTILAKLCWIWFSGFRGESLAYTTDVKWWSDCTQMYLKECFPFMS